MTMSLAHRSTPTTRESRGIALALDRLDEIQMLRPSVFRVPACSGGHAYVVNIKLETCSCEDSIYGGNVCKHIFAARIVKAKTTRCEGCGQRVRVRGTVECFEGNHDNLRYFDGDLVCFECAGRDGVIF